MPITKGQQLATYYKGNWDPLGKGLTMDRMILNVAHHKNYMGGLEYCEFRMILMELLSFHWLLITCVFLVLKHYRKNAPGGHISNESFIAGSLGAKDKNTAETGSFGRAQGPAASSSLSTFRSSLRSSRHSTPHPPQRPAQSRSRHSTPHPTPPSPTQPQPLPNPPPTPTPFPTPRTPPSPSPTCKPRPSPTSLQQPPQPLPPPPALARAAFGSSRPHHGRCPSRRGAQVRSGASRRPQHPSSSMDSC